jgi:hypothetical protein
MKTLAIGLLFLALLPAGTALAHDHDGPSVSLKSCCESPTRWSDRWDRDDARFAMTTEDGAVTMLLDGESVALQLSDQSMRKVRRELRKEENDDDDNPIGQALKAAVLGTVRSLLDHSIECPVRDLRSADYRDGRLVLVANDGHRVFGEISVDHQDVLESFSDRDARAFVAEFQRVKHRR